MDALRDDNHAARRHLALYNANTNWNNITYTVADFRHN